MKVPNRYQAISHRDSMDSGISISLLENTIFLTSSLLLLLLRTHCQIQMLIIKQSTHLMPVSVSHTFAQSLLNNLPQPLCDNRSLSDGSWTSPSSSYPPAISVIRGYLLLSQYIGYCCVIANTVCMTICSLNHLIYLVARVGVCSLYNMAATRQLAGYMSTIIQRNRRWVSTGVTTITKVDKSKPPPQDV